MNEDESIDLGVINLIAEPTTDLGILNLESGQGIDLGIIEFSLDGGSTGNGIGILSIEQITTSTESNGENVIRITLTNGNYSDFVVRNGSAGDSGELTDEEKEALIEEVIQAINLSTYATQTWVEDKHYLTGITSQQIINALGYTPMQSFEVTGATGTLVVADGTVLTWTNGLLTSIS